MWACKFHDGIPEGVTLLLIYVAGLALNSAKLIPAERIMTRNAAGSGQRLGQPLRRLGFLLLRSATSQKSAVSSNAAFRVERSAAPSGQGSFRCIGQNSYKNARLHKKAALGVTHGLHRPRPPTRPLRRVKIISGDGGALPGPITLDKSEADQIHQTCSHVVQIRFCTVHPSRVAASNALAQIPNLATFNNK